MNRSIHLLLFLVVIVVSDSVIAQAENATDSSTMLDLLKPGQIVNISESPLGYRIELLTTRQVEEAIEARRKNPEKFGISGKRTPQQSFALSHPVIKAVARDHVTVLHDVPGIQQLQRHIAVRAIVEIYSYDRPRTDDVDAKTKNLPEQGKSGN